MKAHPPDFAIHRLRHTLEQHWDGLQDHPERHYEVHALEALIERSKALGESPEKGKEAK